MTGKRYLSLKEVGERIGTSNPSKATDSQNRTLGSAPRVDGCPRPSTNGTRNVPAAAADHENTRPTNDANGAYDSYRSYQRAHQLVNA